MLKCETTENMQNQRQLLRSNKCTGKKAVADIFISNCVHRNLPNIGNLQINFG